jgi:hypothetical protein
MENEDFELILNDITFGESCKPFSKDFEEYTRTAYLFLNHKGKHLFSKDILEHYSNEMTLEKLFEVNKGRFVQGANMKYEGELQKTWYDVWGYYKIERKDNFFDFFFTCKLRQLSLLDIEGYLNYHLENSFENDKPVFFNFLNLTIKKFQGSLLTDKIIETTNEWITSHAEIKSNQEKNHPEELIKGRKHRESGDKLTTLNQNQTVLLIEFMQKAGIILNEEYLNYTQAGKALNILTGYSPHTIRQQLGSKGYIEGVKFEDFKELHEAVINLSKLIEPHVRKK